MDEPFINVKISKTFLQVLGVLTGIGMVTVASVIAIGIYYVLSHLQWVN